MKIGNSAPQAGAPKVDGPQKEAGASIEMPKESAGDIANRIATNSNTKPTRVVNGKGNPNMGKDAFFQLMMAQTKNQDPTNPLKSHEMAAQLAQFSSLEQMSNIHSVLSDMKKAQGNDSQYQALDLMGKTISGDNGKIDRMSGDEKHNIGFNLNDSASDVKVAISDAKGKVVKVIDLTSQPKGAVNLEWDGRDMDGNVLPPGNYKMSAEGKDLQGHKISVDTKFKGAVTGVQFTEKGPVMMIGNKTVLFKDVKQIENENKQPSTMGMGGMQGLNPGMMPMGPAASASANHQPGGSMLAMGGDSIMPPMQMPMNLNPKL
jgi:flagellar basal-body rod modification protein FlgD